MTALLDPLAATWPPAEIVRLGPWTLRRGTGAGNRVSAATLDGPLADPDPAEAAMRAWGQPPLFMIRPGEDALDAALAARGHLLADPTAFYTAPAAVVARTIPDESTMFGPAPLACMAEMWAAGGIGPERLAVMARVSGPRAYLLGRLGDRPAGSAFVALHGTVAMLHTVAPSARRQGLGARMTRAAAAWARDAGATTFALAVTRANAPARALYAGLGMAEAGGYHYRRAQEGENP